MMLEQKNQLRRKVDTMAQIEKRQSNIDNLMKLIKDNPDLEILPMVGGGVYGGDEFDAWLGSWGQARIEYIHNPDKETSKYLDLERMYILSQDEEHIREEIYDYLTMKLPPEYARSEVPFESILHKTDLLFKEIEWEKVIVVYIDSPNLD